MRQVLLKELGDMPTVQPEVIEYDSSKIAFPESAFALKKNAGHRKIPEFC